MKNWRQAGEEGRGTGDREREREEELETGRMGRQEELETGRGTGTRSWKQKRKKQKHQKHYKNKHRKINRKRNIVRRERDDSEDKSKDFYYIKKI